jgi:threonine dehydratase
LEQDEARVDTRARIGHPSGEEDRPMPLPVTRADVDAACETIRPHIRRTPVIAVDAADLGLSGPPVTFKLEFLQHTGSFKARGAMLNMLTRAVPPAGVAAASGGNHGAAVAWAAARAGVPAHIFVPEISPWAKIARIESYGATLHVDGAAYVEALAACEAHIARTGAIGIHAYDQVETLAGQGTTAREFAEDAAVDTILVATGGGGLIGGMAAWAGDRLGIVSVEPETSACLHAALQAGRPVDVEVSGVAADSLGARRTGDLVYEIARAHVDAAVLVPDDAIRAAQALLWDRLRIVAEPGGATALAGLVSGAYRPAQGERVGVLLCGANTGAVSFDG